MRLLPGDPAPDIKLKHVSAPEFTSSLELEGISVVVLWGVGCSYCMPALREAARLIDEHGASGVRGYGIAIMIRDADGDHVIAEARSEPLSLTFGIEAPHAGPSPYSRGWMTRHWHEPSGQKGVPAGYIVDASGTIAWIGHPQDMKLVLPAIVAGEWDVAAARKKVREEMSDEQVENQCLYRDLVDTLGAGDFAGADEIIRTAERDRPSIGNDTKFASVKFARLSLDPDMRDAAADHWRQFTDRRAGDMGAVAEAVGWIFNGMPANQALLTEAVERLEAARKGAGADGQSPMADDLLRLNMVRAEADLRLGRFDAAAERSARVLAQEDDAAKGSSLRGYALSRLKDIAKAADARSTNPDPR